MNPVILFLALVVMPPTLMAASHVYAVFSQDVKEHYIVVLHPKASVTKVTADHARRYKVHVDQVFDASIKGYAAFVPLRQLDAIKADRRVVRVEKQEVNETSDRWITN